MNCDAANLPVDDLAFTGVHAGADLEPELVHAVGDRAGTSNRARGAIEAGEEAIPGSVELLTAEAEEFVTDERMMALEQLTPATVAEGGGSFGRADDVGEEQGREHAVRPFLLPAFGIPDVLQEPFDLCADQRGRLAEGEMAGSRDLHDALALGIREAM